jgi:hypothetical protein
MGSLILVYPPYQNHAYSPARELPRAYLQLKAYPSHIYLCLPRGCIPALVIVRGMMLWPNPDSWE